VFSPNVTLDNSTEELMVTYRKGIPDDTPENTIDAIRDILQEEAEQIGASFQCAQKDSNAVGIEITIDIALKEKWVRVFLSCIKSDYLARHSGTIGTGFISWGSGSCTDGLFSFEMFHGCPPYRWSIYPGQIKGLTEPSDRFLHGPFLRATIRHKLSL